MQNKYNNHKLALLKTQIQIHIIHYNASKKYLSELVYSL